MEPNLDPGSTPKDAKQFTHATNPNIIKYWIGDIPLQTPTPTTSTTKKPLQNNITFR